MAFNIDPNAAPLVPTGAANPYGAPPDASQGGLPVIQGKSGSMHLPGGGSPFTNHAGTAAKPGFAPPSMPPIQDYLAMRASTDKIPSLGSADDETLTGLANDYAKTYVPAFHESQGYKLDKNQRDKEISDFMMGFHKDLPKYKDYFSKKENASAPGVKPAKDSSTAGQFIKEQLGAQGDQDYGKSGADYAVDNPLTRGLAQAGNSALSGAGYVAGHPLNTVTGLLGNTLPAHILRQFSPELENFMHQNHDDPATADWINKHYVNPMTGQPFNQESAQLQTPKTASPLEAAGQFGSNLAGTLAIAAAGGESAGALKAGAAGQKVASALTYGVPAGGEAAQHMDAQGKPVDPDKMAALISTAVTTGLIPASVGGSLLKRLGSGAAIGVGANAASNAAAGNPLMQGALPAAAVGAGFGVLPHGGAAPTAKPGAPEAKLGAPTPTGKPGEPPPPGAGAAPVSDAYKQAYASTVSDPEHQVKPGTTAEKALPTLIEARDQFEARLSALDESMTPEAKAAATQQFEQDWRKQFGVPEEPAPAATAPVKEAATPTPEEAAAAVTEPEPTHPGAVREEAAAGPTPGEIREQAETAEPLEVRDLVTQKGVDTRLPFGVTERVATELRNSLQRDPTPEEINSHANMVMEAAGVDVKNVAQREAFGKLLEEDPTKLPTPEDIKTKADEIKDGLKAGSAQHAVSERLKHFEKSEPVKTSPLAKPRIKLKNPLPKAEGERAPPYDPKRLDELEAKGEDRTPEEEAEHTRLTAEDARTADVAGEKLPGTLNAVGWARRPNKRAFEGVLDLDHFKPINDTYGHDVGDKALLAVRDALNEAFGPGEHGRTGGDEFKFQADSQAEINAKVEKAREILKRSRIEAVKDGKVVGIDPIDFSHGTAPRGDNPKATAKAADESLYRNKAERTAKGLRKGSRTGDTPRASEPDRVGSGHEEAGDRTGQLPGGDEAEELGGGPTFESLRGDITKLGRRVDKGRVTDAEFTNAARRAAEELLEKNRAKRYEQMLKDYQRGPDWIRERLLRARRSGELDGSSVDLALWALDKNPAIAHDLAISLRTGKSAIAGRYNPLLKMIQLAKEGGNEGTVIHEILHHTERMMPNDIQEGIHKAWAKSVSDAFVEAQKAGNKEREKALLNLLKSAFDKDAHTQMLKDFAKGTLNYDKDYQLSNPSEFWAVNGTRILGDRAANTTPAAGWVSKARQYLSELGERIKGFFGLKSDSAVLKGLKHILGEGNAGDFKSYGLLAEATSPTSAGKIAGRPEPKYALYASHKPTAFKTLDEVRNAWHQTEEPTKEEQRATGEEKVKDWTTRNVNELKPLQHLNRAMEKLGTKIDAAKNIFMSMTNLGGRVRHEVNHDIANYAEPAKAEFVKAATQLGFSGQKGFKEFLGHVTDAISARHALDVNKLEYYKTVKLSPEAEALRAPLLQDVFNGKLDPKEWMPKLREIVNAPGAKIETGGKRQASGLSDEMAYKLIESARKAGITDQVAEHLNSVLDPIRQRTLARGRESGAYTPEQGRIVQAYNSKWYLPFKGFAEDGATGIDNTRRSIGAFNKDTTAAREGRASQSKNPLENLFTDLANGGKDVAYNETAKTIFKAVSDPAINKKLGVRIKSYDINKLTNDALKGGGKLSDMAGIWRDPNTVIYKNGKDWHVMHFPEDSKELQAIKSIESDKSLKGLSAKASIATNFIARGKTAYSPIFTLYSALARDSTGYPILAAADHGPAIAGSYVKNLVGFGGPFGAWRTYANLLKGNKGVNNFGNIEKMAQANPNSFAGWAYRLSKSGGGLDFKAELSNIKTAQGLAKQMNADARNPLHPAKLVHSAAEFLDSLATSSIATGRVSMFKALVESGMSDIEAGHYTKRMENFEQTSEGSRQMNAWFPFWRAGIANADRMYDLVHKPNGDFDRAKFGKLMVTGVAAAAAYWNFVLKQYYGDDAKKLKLNTLSQNFVIPNPNGDPIKIPMGLGLPRLMLGLGIIATRIGEGSTTPAEAYEAIKSTLAENLTPLKPSEGKDNATAGDRALDLLMAAVPGFLKAPAEIARNQSTFGRDIHATPYPNDTRFESASGFRSTPDEWKDLAQGLHKATGIDTYPESLEYLANSYGQGYLTEALRAFTLEAKQNQGKETSITDRPFVPRFTTGDIRYADTNAFYEKKNELQDAVKESNALKADNKPIPPDLQKRLDAEKKFNAASRAHSKEVKQVEDNALLSKEAKASKLAAINAKFATVQKQLTAGAP